jgi:hypothetical protein
MQQRLDNLAIVSLLLDAIVMRWMRTNVPYKFDPTSQTFTRT